MEVINGFFTTKCKERSITDINSIDKRYQINKRNTAGEKILERCRELIKNIENAQLEGPHSYKLARKIAEKNNLRIVVYKDNKIKHAFPEQFDGEKVQIALLESTPSYVDRKDQRRHVNFLRKPKRFFGEKMFQCPLCLAMKSPNRRHSKCARNLCKFCHKLQLKINDYHDKTFKIEFCVQSKQHNIKLVNCKLCKKEIPETCLKSHEKICKRCYECANCKIVLTARSVKSLKTLVDKHVCNS